MAYEVIEVGNKAADVKIVSLEMAKMNSKIEFEDEDPLLQIFVDSASAEIENYVGYPVLLREDCVIQIDKWFKSFVPSERLAEITSVTYQDKDDNTQTIDAADYTLITGNNMLRLDIAEPENFGGSVTVNCKIGYSETDMPADIKAAALLIFAQQDTYRENGPIKMETAAKAKLRPYKKY